MTDKCGDACDCVSQGEKGRSLKSCPVKNLVIYEFGGTMRELEMIKHFLEYFPCLKEMVIYAAEENSPKMLKDPEMVELIGKMMYLYNKLSSCNVQLLVHREVECTVKSKSE